MNKTLLLALLGLAAICRVSFGATDHSSVPNITYQCFVIASEKPIQHDFSKLTNQSGIDILSAPKILTRVGLETTVRVSREIYPEHVIGLKDPKPIHVGISIALTGKLDQDKITLLGKMTSTEAGTPKTSPASTSLETSSSDLYFSTITTSGGEAWFDVDRLFLKNSPILMGKHPSRYYALRIVPTLVP